MEVGDHSATDNAEPGVSHEPRAFVLSFLGDVSAEGYRTPPRTTSEAVAAFRSAKGAATTTFPTWSFPFPIDHSSRSAYRAGGPQIPDRKPSAKKEAVGHELYYHPGDRHIGSMSIRRWEEVSKLLPLLVDFVNRAMQKDWRPGVVRDVRLFAGGMADPQAPPPDRPPPPAGPFAMEQMLSEELLDINEVRVFKADEWDRLFAWCDFLAERDGACSLYRPLVDVLRPHFEGVDQRD
jgi:hypothetical protein